MKKFLAISAIALSAASTANAHNWYAGVGLGWKEGKFKGTFLTDNLAAASNPYLSKASFSKGSAFGSLFGGHKFTLNACDIFVQFNASKDFGKADKKSVSPNSTAVGGIGTADVSIQRLGTVGMDVGVSKSFKGVDVYVKMGLVASQFEFKLTDTTPNQPFSTKSSRCGIGFAPGLGFEKNLGSMALGFGYEYQLYKKVQYNNNDPAKANYNSIWASPRYHVFALNIKKAF